MSQGIYCCNRRRLRHSTKLFSALLFFSFSLGQSVYGQTTIGLGSGFMPKYEGAKKYKAQIYPLFSHEKDNFFVAPKAEMPAIGVQAHLGSGWKAGVFGAYASGRKARYSSHLRGTNNIKPHAAGGAFVSLKSQRLSFDVTYFHALRKKYGGGFRVGGGYLLFQDQGTTFSMGGALNWGDGDSMNTNFGVSQTESQRSGGRLKPFKSSSGLQSMTVNGTFSQQLSTNWGFYSTLGVKRLLGDAADSPITQRKTSVYGGVGLSYTFR